MQPSFTTRLLPGSPKKGPSGTCAGIFGTWVACMATCLVLCWLLVPAVIVLQSLRGSAPLGSGENDHFIGLAQHVPLLRELQILPVYSHLQGVGPASQLSKRQQKPLRLKRPAASQQQGTSARAHSSAHSAGHIQKKEEKEEQQQQQYQLQKQQQQQQKVRPVDVVYLWVNGSDPQLLQELQDLEQGRTHASTTASSSIRQSGSQNDAVRQARFDAGRDELRYSIRSLELYLPWYRHLYIVTNGQVPSWLRLDNPRITVVPHSSIFPNASHLPTFNSNAIQANLANIPGLSEHFIMMEDDLFLTAPWTLEDFVSSTGGHVLTGTANASAIEAGGTIYLQGIKHLADVFEQRFGPWPRYDPAHAMKFMQLQWLRELQGKLAEEFRQTSATRVRLPTDVIIGAAYQWYVAQHQPGDHPTAPAARTLFHNINELTARSYVAAAVADFRTRVAAGEPKALAVDKGLRHDVTWYEMRAAAIFEAGRVSAGNPGVHLSRFATEHLFALVKAWSTSESSMVCLNDDIPDALTFARPLLNNVVRDFLRARYNTPSQYEVFMGGSNGCEGRLPKTAFGQLPTQADYAAICGNEAAATIPIPFEATPSDAANRAARSPEASQPGQQQKPNIDTA